jgi:hypothetical protein
VTYHSHVLKRSSSSGTGRSYTREGQESILTVIKDNQNWTINNGIITAKNDAVATNLEGLDPLDGGYPNYRCRESCNGESYFTSKARCIYAEKNGSTVKLYIVGYNGMYAQQNRTIRTALQFGQWHFRYNWGLWEPVGYSKPRFVTGNITSNAWDRYVNRNTVCQYLKKLDAIAFYSKAKYPYLDGLNDPGEPDANTSFPWDGQPYPQSYRRVMFRYNYELARGTPNSLDAETKAMNGGRLTLKEVREVAGDENVSVSMPPTLFSYQTHDATTGNEYRYVDHAHTDAWGFRTVGTEPNVDNSQDGVNWNLTRVQLPSCGNIAFSFERDKLSSIYGSLYKLKLLSQNKCLMSSSELYPAEGTAGTFYVQSRVTNISNNVVTVMNSNDLEPGMYTFLQVHALQPLSCLESKIVYNYTKYWYKIISKSGNVLTLDRAIIISSEVNGFIPNPSVNTFTLLGVKPQVAWCGDIRTTSVLFSNLTGNEQTVYDYDQSGDIEILPISLLPVEFTVPYKLEYDPACNPYPHDGLKKRRYFDQNIFSADVQFDYNTGNTMVLYPMVKVFAVVPGTTTKIAGETQYSFYTSHDLVNNKPLKEEFFDNNGQYEGVSGIKVRKVIDRTGIIGMPKGIKHIAQNGNVVVYEGSAEYKFSDEIGIASTDAPKAFYNTLRTTLTADKAPGLIKERTIHKEISADGLTVTPKSVFDISYSRPYLVRSTSKIDGLFTEVRNGLIDALTGSPVISTTLNKNGTGNAEYKGDVALPYYLLLDQTNTNQRDQLKLIQSKNQYTLPGAAFTCKLNGFSTVNPIQDIINTHNSDLSNPIIKTASAQTWAISQEVDGWSSAYMPYVSRLYMKCNYLWKGGNFEWPLASTNNWLKGSEIAVLDRYSRSLTVKNSNGTPITTVYHPYLGSATGVIVNAMYYESSVLTGDYADGMDPAYFDKANGWHKGTKWGTDAVIEITSTEKHFGQKSIHVKDATAALNAFKIDTQKDYILSAWVKPLNGKRFIRFGVELRKANGSSVGDWIGGVDLIRNDLQPGVWQYIEHRVRASELVRHVQAGHTVSEIAYYEVWIGQNHADRLGLAEFCMDDIRFYPAKALVTTSYYDQNLGVVTGVVDANNHGAYVKYDEFGRVVESGKIRD